MIRRLAPFLVIIITGIPVFGEDPGFTISERTFHWAEKQYGPLAKSRLLDWQDLMRSHNDDDLSKLEKVNLFFNKMKFTDDYTHWGQDDYWATPTEFVASGGGDCEDFSIAKYFTLIGLGIPEQQLTLTYVKALRFNMPHMVLAYYPAPGMEPLVLDNLVDIIEPSSQRSDLLPVYSFNASGLWDAKIRGQGEKLGDGRRIRPWRELLIKMNQDLPNK